MCLLFICLCLAGDKMWADKTWVGSLNVALHLLLRTGTQLERILKEAMLPIAMLTQVGRAAG